MKFATFEPASSPLRAKVFEVIFGSETPAGKRFDVLLFIAIGLSVSLVMIESIASLRHDYNNLLVEIEWILTSIFAIEYAVRLWCVKRPTKYAFSFFGIIDFVSMLPSFIALILPQGQYLMVVRVVRLLRVFRVLKMTAYVSEANTLMTALYATRRKIGIFLYSILMVVIVLGSLMYVIEGPEHGFTSIPRGIYWAIVTMTTVGYGDIAPQTAIGQSLAALVMILGYAIIAVPTGIVTAELTSMHPKEAPKQQTTAPANLLTCSACGNDSLRPQAKFCDECGEKVASNTNI